MVCGDPVYCLCQVLEHIEELLVLISHVVNMEIQVEYLVYHYSPMKDDVATEYDDTIRMGEQLVDRLKMPVLTHEG